MKKNKLKKELYRILLKTPSEMSLTEYGFVYQYLTYELLEEFIDDTGLAVLLPGITEDEVKYSINITELLQYFTASERSRVE